MTGCKCIFSWCWCSYQYNSQHPKWSLFFSQMAFFSSGKSRVSKPNWTHTECKMGLEIESWNETKMEFWEKIWISENLQKLLQWLLKLHSISAISDLCLWKSYENVVLHDFLETHTEARIIFLFITSIWFKIAKFENFRYFESKFKKKSHFKLFSVKFHLRHLQGDPTSFG